MSGHNICLFEEVWKIIPKLSLLLTLSEAPIIPLNLLTGFRYYEQTL